MEKYGVPWGFQSESVKEKIETTLLDKYGVRSLFQLPEVREKAMNAISENIDEVNLKKQPHLLLITEKHHGQRLIGAEQKCKK